MKNRLKWTVCTLIALLLSGCVGNMSSIRHQFNVKNGNSQLIDVKQRGVYIAYKNKPQEVKDKEGNKITQMVQVPIICAEPSPDAMSAYAAQIAAKGGNTAKSSGELSGAMQESSSFIGMRTASIQALRDYSYRICEAYMNGGINEIQYESLLRRYQKNLVVLFAIEQLSGVNRVPIIALVSQGGTEQAASSGKGAANAGGDTGDKGVDESKKTNVLTNSTIAIVVPTNNNSPQATSEIAQHIYDLSQDMITADEFGSLCLSVVQNKSFNEGSNNDADTSMFNECLNYLKNNNSSSEVKYKDTSTVNNTKIKSNNNGNRVLSGEIKGNNAPIVDELINKR